MTSSFPHPAEPSVHTLDLAEAVRRLETDLSSGLASDEAARRLKESGPNEIARADRRHPLFILRDQFLSPMILLLLAVIGVSIAIGHATDAAIIGGIVALNAWIGFFQEFKAERAMESIRRIGAPSAKILRDGQMTRIAAHEVAWGDVVVLEAGDRVPADLRLAEAAALQADESLLTGESVPVFKHTRPLAGDDLPIGDLANMAFAGTLVIGGRSVGIVSATGQKTELGRIASLLSPIKKGETPLKKRLEKLTRQLVLAAFGLCAILFAVGVLWGHPALDMLLASLSLGIASIPEGLPAVITVSLSLGSLRLAKRGALIRQLPAVEGLGSITVICADKTGTLTQNKMKVRYPTEGSLPPLFLEALVLCNDARQNEGDPMETALLAFAAARGLEPESARGQWKRISELPFDTDRKRMATVHESGGRRILFVKGAPEKVLALCSWDDDKSRQGPEAAQNDLAEKGLRVLAVAMKELRTTEPSEASEDRLTFLGFIGLQDPPRAEAKAAIAECRAAGIRPIMITGDHQATAVAIARELGIYSDGDAVITGLQLKKESAAWLAERVGRASVFARVSPEDKLTIIQALKEKNEFVAMTGDGVNDAPALRRADIGIAMGRGTDVAKEASSIILVDENFSTIVSAVREGRVIYDNIRKFVRYMLGTNFGEIAAMLLAAIAGMPAPLLPVHILWINLVTDGLPAVTLGYEPAEGDVMARKPRPTNEGILSRGLWQHVLWVGFFMGLLTVGMLFLFPQKDVAFLRTVAFTSLTFAQMGHVLAIRSETRPLWRIGFLSNWRLMGAVGITVAMQAAIVTFAPFRLFFSTAPLSFTEGMICLVPAVLIFTAVEIEKKLRLPRRDSRVI